MHRIGGIILAAGGSTRMGQPKQLLNLHGTALVCNAVRAAQEAGCDPVCVVTGHAREAVETALAPLHPRLVYNPHWQLGIGTSIRLGLAALPPVSAVILLTCDQPAVTGAVIRTLIQQHAQTRCPIVASSYAGTLGVPALFDHTCFPELLQIPDHQGAKPVIQSNASRVASVDFPAGEVDLDSPQDVAAWRSAHRDHVGSSVG